MPQHLLNAQFITTFVLFAGCVGAVGFMAWWERRPRESLTPDLVPARAIILVAGFVGLLALVHLLNLLGVQTGR